MPSVPPGTPLASKCAKAWENQNKSKLINKNVDKIKKIKKSKDFGDYVRGGVVFKIF